MKNTALLLATLLAASGAAYAEDFGLASFKAADVKAADVVKNDVIPEPAAKKASEPAGEEKSSQSHPGLRACQTPGDRTVIQCQGSDLKYRRPASNGQYRVQAPYYTVNICADSNGRHTIEVWPFQFFSDHAIGDMRTISRNLYAPDRDEEGYYFGYSGKQYTGHVQFTLALPKEGDAIRRAVFYDGAAPYGNYHSKGDLFCLING